MQDFISVIIPVYQVEEYLRECVDSVLAQTYRNLEVILVEDGSPDRCGEICDAYQKSDQRISVIHKENGGLSDARNAGLDKASGQYVLFVDSDDWIHPEMVQCLYEKLKDADADISYCGYLEFLDGEKPELSERKQVSAEVSTGIKALGKLYSLDHKENVALTIACAKLYRRSLFEQIRYPVGKQHEDEFVTYRLIYRAEKVVKIDQPFYYYRKRNSSIMGKGFDFRSLDKLDADKERIEFFQKNKAPYYEEAVRDYLNDCIFYYFEIQRQYGTQEQAGKQLRKRMRSDYSRYLPETDFTWKRKWNYQLFMLSPQMYQFILMHLYKRIRER